VGSFDGSNLGNGGMAVSEPISTHGRPYSLSLTLPPPALLALTALRINSGATPISSTLLDKHFLHKHGASATYWQSNSS